MTSLAFGDRQQIKCARCKPPGTKLVEPHVRKNQYRDTTIPLHNSVSSSRRQLPGFATSTTSQRLRIHHYHGSEEVAAFLPIMAQVPGQQLSSKDLGLFRQVVRHFESKQYKKGELTEAIQAKVKWEADYGL